MLLIEFIYMVVVNLIFVLALILLMLPLGFGGRPRLLS